MIAAGLFAVALVASAPPPSIEAARRDEVELLRRERDALRSEIEEADAAGKAATRSLTTEIESLAAELERVQADNAARERRLPAIERARGATVQQRRIDELGVQMSAWLAARGVAARNDAGDPAGLAALFASALSDIRRSSALRVDAGATYYAADGEPHAADVLRIGEVAAVTWDEHAIALLPTPEGLQEVVGVDPVRERLPAGERVGVVLHDPDTRADPRAWTGWSWASTMDRGGPLMWVLLVIAVVAMLVVVERSLVLAWIALRWRRTVPRIEALGGLDADARRERLANERDWLALPLVIVAGQPRAPGDPDPDRAAIEERATRAVIVVRERLFRRLSLLSLAAGVAPLAGLLGTVNGMITTFSVVTTKGTSDAQLLAGGISEALLTTQFGLVIAIPALIGHSLLSRGARRTLVAIEQTVLRHIHGIAVPDRSEVVAAAPAADPAPTTQASRMAMVGSDE